MQATLHFTSFAAARAFLASSQFSNDEIVEVGAGFVTVTEYAGKAAEWANNPMVYSVEWK